MSGWKKIGAVISVLWMIGLPIYFIVRSNSFKTVGHALLTGDSDTAALWTMMLAPVVLLWSLGVLTPDAVRWIRRRLSERGPSQ
jgi:uncharacterized membrane protein YjgN (DUF898 family)